MTSTLCSTYARSSTTDFLFWKSVKILLKKPHVVNKRLWGSKTLFRYTCKPIVPNWNLPLNCERLKNTHIIEEFRKNVLDELQIIECPEEIHSLEIVLVELLPKVYSENHAFQLVVLQKENGEVTFYNVTPGGVQQHLCPDFPYTLCLNQEGILLTAVSETSSKSYLWLKDTVLPQFVKWGEECPNKEKQHFCKESLTLVSNEKYYIKYNDLKFKYGKEMVKIWPECTDPSKFVYEDIAIATYLLLLWEDEKSHLNMKDQQTFVDLGCGNGLLVYILTNEGHYGVGIDVRKRQIWDMYTDVKLEERTITPSDTHLFPKTDWVIGNHSDELTPWIPVIAARSSYDCKFFLLPCCAYNFDGTKYQRQNSSKSQYTEYLEYIKQLCEDCGFKTDTDRLKIPSTKRICLVGRERAYPHEEHDKYCHSIQNLINNKTNCVQGNDNNQTSWIKDFKARDPVERVRNCTQIDKTLIENIVDSISKHLLEGCSFNSNWTEGRTVDIADVVQLISQDKLKSLKSECGGLQTLLKNNHHIFKVQSGKVQLRHPKTVEEVTNGFKSSVNKVSIKLKEKPCWFHNNHPQGCPLSDNNCSFLHVKK